MSHTSAFSGLEPQGLWKHFEAFTRIPRPSGSEQDIAAYVCSWAAERGYPVVRDKVGNVCVHVPGRGALAGAAPIVLQSHLDMVCERNADCPYDTAKGTMHVVRNGDWLSAEGTTLGADNGIGCSAMLHVAELGDLACAPLDLLFTLDEERGLTGVKQLDPNMLRGRTLLNLDSEDETTVTVGCAGGCTTSLQWSDRREPLPAGWTQSEWSVTGLKGGHSGMDIDKNRLNAIKAMARTLQSLLRRQIPLRLARLDGGDKSNAIPRECRAAVCHPAGSKQAVREEVERTRQTLAAQYAGLDDSFRIGMSEPALDKTAGPFTPDGTHRFLDLLCAIPSGVIAMTPGIVGLVETSNNLSSVRTDADGFRLVCSSRSSNAQALGEVLDAIQALARMAGATAQRGEGYPGWKPDMTSRALAVLKQTYRRLFSKEITVMGIHAGLECGLIGERIPGMDMISLGPMIQGVHAPGERVNIASVERFARLLAAVLSDLSR
ncbi:MAG TPA: beta-Ala-His dipeptidase [Phycisphaerae bacterium]|nr:beta-Ala-His dipeptidase [Phycisphaerae bacterium]HRY70616.1 beta-Ala-His dipeptidase [Phycisphaerae bacterium]HSA30158.1 beta-Ala-His dipeptidase [Phycisphaerae bacterium]